MQQSSKDGFDSSVNMRILLQEYSFVFVPPAAALPKYIVQLVQA